MSTGSIRESLRAVGSGSRRTRGVCRMPLLCVSIAAIGCQTAMVRSGVPLPSEGTRVLLMPPDVEVYVETAAGMLEPQARESAEAMRSLTAAIGGFLDERGGEIVEFTESEDPERQHLHQQIQKLHRVVARAVADAKYIQMEGQPVATRAERLPTMKGRFEWSLGEETRALQQDSGARYALFVFVNDSRPGAHRVGVMAVVSTAFGVAPLMGEQEAYASLVDLETGNLVWFNYLYREGTAGALSPAGVDILGIPVMGAERASRRFVAQLLDALPLAGAP